MTWYQFLLFFHVSMAVIWVGGGAMVQLFALRAMAAPDPMRMAEFGGDVEYIANRVFIPASLLAFGSGIWLVLDSDFWGFGDDWITLALILFAITFLAGALFLGRRRDASRRPPRPRARPRRSRWLGCSVCSPSRAQT